MDDTKHLGRKRNEKPMNGIKGREGEMRKKGRKKGKKKGRKV